MPRKTMSNVALPYAPVAPLAASDGTRWIPAEKIKNAWRLGNRASVEEVSGQADPARQSWRWRIVAFGGETGICSARDPAMRAAEFCLGLGELEIVEVQK